MPVFPISVFLLKGSEEMWCVWPPRRLLIAVAFAATGAAATDAAGPVGVGETWNELLPGFGDVRRDAAARQAFNTWSKMNLYIFRANKQNE